MSKKPSCNLEDGGSVDVTHNVACCISPEAVAALRAEIERLTAENHDLSLAGFTLRDGNKQMLDEIVAADARIAELTAALIAIDLLSSQGFAPALTEIGKIAAAALKGEGE